ncbi:MAG: hypothetical protein ABFD08_02755 [Syntrophomonas sp.]
MNKVSMYITKLIGLIKDRRKENAKNMPIARMVQYIGIAGVREPEKMAEGPCPHCKNHIELWLMSQGIELLIKRQGFHGTGAFEGDCHNR